MSQPAPPPDWYADPFGGHQHRFWDGTAWTDQVADQGTRSTDPLEGGAPLGAAPGFAAVAPPPGSRVEEVVGNAVVVGLAVILLLVSFLDWFAASVSQFDVTETADAWEFTLCQAAVVLGTATAIPAALRLATVEIPAIVILGAGGLAFLLILIKAVIGPDLPDIGFDVEVTREIGIFLGLLTTAGIAGIGAFMMARELARGGPRPSP